MTTEAQQITGYLKLTRAHYLVIDKIEPSPILAIRSELAREMKPETLFLAHDIKDQLTPYAGMIL
jgi:hypothetical protein